MWRKMTNDEMKKARKERIKKNVTWRIIPAFYLALAFMVGLILALYTGYFERSYSLEEITSNFWNLVFIPIVKCWLMCVVVFFFTVSTKNWERFICTRCFNTYHECPNEKCQCGGSLDSIIDWKRVDQSF